MQDLMELAVGAAAGGCIYGLVALAYLVVLRPTGIINFAVGDWATVAAFGGFVALSALELPYLAGMALVIGGAFLLGWLTERVAVRPLIERGAPVLAPILALLGMLVVLREAVSVGFGPDPHPVPQAFGFGRLELGPLAGITLAGSYQSFYTIAVTGAVFGGVWLFFERTLAGKCFEAVAIDRRAAALMGIDLRRVSALAFGAGGAIAGLAGLLVAPNTSAHYLMGVPLAIQGFTALVVGGVGRVEGALVGGLVLSFAEQLTVRYAPVPAGLAQGVPLVLLILFLLVRPTGLLKARREPA
jgi:branched-chain amino acid transport system permease protein